MCGKFTQMMAWGDVVRLSDLLGKPEGSAEAVTPMRFAHVIALDGNGARKAVPMRWGLNGRDGKPHIHARSETLDSKPRFRDAFLERRGLLLVSTFNEGKELTPTKTEQYVLTPTDGAPLAIAVIWEHGSDTTPLTFAMVTVAANALIGTITDRMPALLPESDWAKWLGEEPATIGELKAMLLVSEHPLDMQRAGKPAPPPMPGQLSLL